MEPLQQPIKKHFLIILAVLVAAFSALSTFAGDSDHYRATAEGNILLVHTPSGTRLLFGDSTFGDLNNYRLEIPLEDIASNALSSSASRGGSGAGEARTPGPSMNDDLDQLFGHANELYLKGKFEASQEFVQEILKRDPKNVRALLMKGSLHHAQGNHEAAKEAWKKALEIEPNNKTIKNILENYR